MTMNNHLIKFTSTAIYLACLTACSGSGSDSKDTNAPVVQLNGSATVTTEIGSTYNEQGASATDDVDGDIAVTITGTVDTTTAGDYDLTYSAQDRAGNRTSIIRTVTVTPAQVNNLTVTVKDFFSGEIIDNAMVLVLWQANNVPAYSQATATSAGSYQAELTVEDTRFTVYADAENYGEQSAIINDSNGDITIFLQPANATPSFDATTDNTLSIEGIDVVSLTANSLVDTENNPVTGTVNAEITLIDPSIDPGLMPGDYQTIDALSGVINSIESYGALNVTFESETGEPLDLAEGQTATIQIPVAANAVSPPTTIPLFYFSEQDGYWIEEGTATLTSLANGQQVYQGEVNHFTTWNADIITETTTIEGCVESSTGAPISGAAVFSQGIDYNGTASTLTDSNGNFQLSARINSEVLVSSVATGSASRTAVVNTDTNTLILDTCLTSEEAASVITLTWGEHPRDLDTHFSGPANSEGSEFFHVYFADRNATVGDSIIFLDVDDVSSFGPEITTITFPFDGIYTYSVHHFSGEGNIQSSPARVEVELEGETHIFNPPQGDATLCWSVFDFEVVNGIASVREASRWEDESFCSLGAINESSQSDTNNKPSQLLTNDIADEALLKKEIENKYYDN